MLIGITTYKLHQYKGLFDLTLQCIESIIRQKPPFSFKILISDQRTDNKTLDQLKKYEVELIHEELDCVSRSWNLICQKAFSKNSFFNEYCLILNNDIKLCEGALGQLIDFAKNNPHSIITAPKVFDFSAFLISKDIYHEVGPFDENLKGGSLEDWDYTVRIEEKEISILPCPTFQVFHVGNATKNHVSQDPEICKLLEESLVYYRKKWGDGRHKLP